ncbi:hypothetical protein OQ279_16145 [Salinimicrobium sp. MT39]|uniref:DUF5723 domain-containing protein n=1 Tax=Salinimicrobium profundisediminis TaxID=2994553 RepID=A0A9X3I2N9_9FLAO|nr:hypothetical protein [Salinimicrobium profundisediminis]
MKKLSYLFLLFLLPSALVAQTEDNSQLFINDMLVLAQNFAQPAADGASYQAGAGWFSSAAALEKWDFRVSVHGNALFVPNDKKSFNLSNSDLELLEMEGITSATFPTAFGGSTSEYFVGDVTFENPLTGGVLTEAVRFKGIDGINRDYVPHAFLQASVGVSAGTEITVRAMPEVTIDGVSASTYGIGAKHSLSQYFRNTYAEGFQLAVGASYSKLNVDYEFDPISVQNFLTMNHIVVDANLFLAEVIGSKRWNNLEVFAAAGVMNSNFDYEMGGDGIALPRVNQELGGIEGGQTQFKGDLGLNLYFSRFRLSAMMTAGEFFNANLGLSVGI